MKIIPTLSLLVLNVFACNAPQLHLEIIDLKQVKQEVRQAEKDFNDMAARDGVSAAFLDPQQNVSLTWSPDFVEVASADDLA